MDVIKEAFSNPSLDHLQIYVATGLALLLGLFLLAKLTSKSGSESQKVTMEGLMDDEDDRLGAETTESMDVSEAE